MGAGVEKRVVKVAQEVSRRRTHYVRKESLSYGEFRRVPH